MKLAYIFIVLFMALTIEAGAQKTSTNKTSGYSKQPLNNTSIKSLKIGDKVPDLLIAKIINNDKRTAKISDFKNQLLILDFWDTYCGSCIEALPKLDSMQRKFGNKTKILAVTYQKEDEVTKFFNTNRFLKGLKPACVVEDDLLRNYFKHQIISHEVWIYKGIVKALTTTEYVNAKNIQDVLDEKPINWPVKYDSFDFDPAKPIFSLNEADQYHQKNTFKEFSGITGYREGIDVKRGVAFDDDSVNHVYRTSFLNSSIVDAYKMLLFQSDHIKRGFILTPGRLVLEVKDPFKYVYTAKLGLADVWNRENTFCYEMISSKPVEKTGRIKKVIEDLNLKLGLSARWEKRMVNCIVIYKANLKINPDTVSRPLKPTMSIVASAIPLMNFDIRQIFPPALDETGYKGQIYFGTYSGPDSLRKELQRYGFDYKEEMREIEVMVITENDYKKS